MDLFIHQLFTGLSNGAIYASMALAIVMIFRTTNLKNFAQGEMAMFSAFIAWWMLGLGVPYWIAFFITIAVSFVIGVLAERILIRPVMNAPLLSILIVFFGIFVILHSLAGWIFGYEVKVFPSPFPEEAVFGTYITNHELGTIAIVGAMLLAIYAFLNFTKTGLAMRGVAENQASCKLVGINVNWMLGLGWGLAAAIGAVAGMLIAPVVYLDPSMMSGVLIYGFAGAILGGIDNPWGAVVGSLILGVVENLLGTYVIETELRLSVALVLIIAILLIRPNGIFGRTIVSRV
ncbi:MAG: branched-chain amino acid ABC transporter permease [Roseitalea sp.]|jgi:branched-chain amino acid transport system permease protein|nr:branched-chain amino acid ABC transporter permease [Roseitalea sp.]MBO6722059.1 branched-chain amino acid ABC transporter permease [Roseitalea sp.]MBO6741679.1 branched-chain amino acid ABC transporter permease [Roseitalea sp.]